VATITPLPPDDRRVVIPLFTRTEAAHYVRTPVSTARNWISGYGFAVSSGSKRADPLVHSVPAARGRPSIPFIGIVDLLVLSGFRKTGLSMQKIRKAIDVLSQEIHSSALLAHQRLYTDGAEVLWEYARTSGDEEIGSLVEPSSRQTVFVEAIRQYITLIDYDPFMWAYRVSLPEFVPADVVVDMDRGFGVPILDRYGVPVHEITDRFFYGKDTIEDIAADLGIKAADVESVIQAAPRAA
jgi:uncharacterized protein (DUF433 family)